MAFLTRAVMSLAFLTVAVVVGLGAWDLPVLLRGIEDNDLFGLLVWTFGFLFLVVFSGLSAICAVGIWINEL